MERLWASRAKPHQHMVDAKYGRRRLALTGPPYVIVRCASCFERIALTPEDDGSTQPVETVP